MVYPPFTLSCLVLTLLIWIYADAISPSLSSSSSHLFPPLPISPTSPAAPALASSFLLGSGMSQKDAMNRLFIFAAAAPITAIFTYFCLGTGIFQQDRRSVALCLLFSAGTFLYVATCHVLPEVQHIEKPGNGEDGTGGGYRVVFLHGALLVMGGLIFAFIIGSKRATFQLTLLYPFRYLCLLISFPLLSFPPFFSLCSIHDSFQASRCDGNMWRCWWEGRSCLCLSTLSTSIDAAGVGRQC